MSMTWAKGLAGLTASALIATTIGTAATTYAATTLATRFPKPVTTVAVVPSKAEVIHFDGATVTIPAKTFTEPVKFAVREAPLAGFEVPKGERAVFDFAFIVTPEHGAKLPVFTKPVLFSWTNPAVTAKATYYNVTPAGTLVANPTGLKITGHTLSHPIKADTVGWLITVPAAKTGSAAVSKAAVTATAKTALKKHDPAKKAVKAKKSTKAHGTRAKSKTRKETGKKASKKA